MKLFKIIKEFFQHLLQSAEKTFYSIIILFIIIGTIQNTYHDDITYWLLWIMIGGVIIYTIYWFKNIKLK
jgi:hypothetical protein